MSPDSQVPERNSYSVLVVDLFHYQDPEHELTVHGFPTFELAREYARRRVRDSVEEMRKKTLATRVFRSPPGRLLPRRLAEKITEVVDSFLKTQQTAEEHRRAWYTFGEDAIVIGGESYTGSRDLDRFIAHPARGSECDWLAVERGLDSIRKEWGSAPA